MSTSRTRPAPAAQPRRPGPVDPAPRRPLIVPLLLVLGVVGLGLAAWHTFGPASLEGSTATGTGPLAPAITASTVDGGPFSLAAHRGTVVVLYAMAAWCISCVPEASALGQLAQTERWRRGVATLLVDESPQSDTPQAVRDFRARAQAPARTWVLDQGGTIAQSYGITALDTTVVIDRSGRIAARFSRPVDEATLGAVVERLL